VTICKKEQHSDYLSLHGAIKDCLHKELLIFF
jgi:hypothetical protein